MSDSLLQRRLARALQDDECIQGSTSPAYGFGDDVFHGGDSDVLDRDLEVPNAVSPVIKNTSVAKAYSPLSVLSYSFTSPPPKAAGPCNMPGSSTDVPIGTTTSPDIVMDTLEAFTESVAVYTRSKAVAAVASV